ncbi:MAG: helix-turn-helix transcriptional regulator [Pseudomonadota bacterium]
MATNLSTAPFARMLKHQRKKLGLSREELAEKAECSASTISRLERKERGPSLEMVLKLSHGLDYPAEKLVKEIAREFRQLANL